jgi:hypothetical protein
MGLFILTLMVLLLLSAFHGDTADAVIARFVLGIGLAFVSMKFLGEVATKDCESLLPRNQQCVLIAVPEDKAEQIMKGIEK